MTYGFFVLKETLPRTLRRKFELKRANPLGALLKIRRYPMLVGLLVALFFYNVGHHVYPANWSFYVMEKFRWTAFDIGVSLGFVGVLLALVQGGLIRVAIPRLGAPRTALIGLFAATAAYIGFAFAPNGLALYLWCFVAAVSGLIMPALQGMMSAEVPQNEQGELQGMIASVGSVGAIVGPLLLTQLFGYFTSSAAPVYFPGAAFLAAGVLSLLALMLFVKSARIDRELPELVR
jgi:DHA1 family tetracycline resistance protein-like MFS transporter